MVTSENIIPCMAVPPIEIVRDEMKARKISLKEFASRLEMQSPNLCKMFKSDAPITVQFAAKLERALDIPADFWLRLQASYERDVKSIQKRNAEESDAVTTERMLFGICNMAELYKRLKIEGSLFVQEKLSKLSVLFGTDASAFIKNVPIGTFKMSDKLNVDEKNLRTWVVLANIEAMRKKCATQYKEGNALKAANEIVSSVHSGHLTEAGIEHILNRNGITYCVVPKLDRVPVDAYSSVRGNHYSIIVTHRHNDMSRLVFNVLHELGHLQLHAVGEDETNIAMDGNYTLSDPKEIEANDFAKDMLIPSEVWKDIMNGAASSIYPNAILTQLKKASKKHNLDFGIVSWRYRYETQHYALKLKAQKIR